MAASGPSMHPASASSRSTASCGDAEAHEIVQQRQLEDVTSRPARTGAIDLADVLAGRRQIAAARLEPGPRPLARRRPTWRPGCRRPGRPRSRAAAASAHSPSSRWPWATPTWAHTSAASWPALGAASATSRKRRIASWARPVSRAISASAISNQTHAPIALVASARSAAGSSSSRASRVAAGVGQGVGLVERRAGRCPGAPASPGSSAWSAAACSAMRLAPRRSGRR